MKIKIEREADGARTRNTRGHSPVLYQLSYSLHPNLYFNVLLKIFNTFNYNTPLVENTSVSAKVIAFLNA